MDFRAAADFGKISQALDKIKNKGNFETDERFWMTQVDKTGVAYALIRFLPTPPMDGPDGVPILEHIQYSFKGPSGKWYINDSPVMIGGRDPVKEANDKEWKRGDEGAVVARQRPRKVRYLVNIYVIDDAQNPENNGKVFLYKAPKQVYDKIQAALAPRFKSDKPINPFDLINGANFHIKIAMKDNKYPNYEASEFDRQATPLFPDEDRIREVYSKAYSLKEFLDPSRFKSYDELAARFKEVWEDEVVENTLASSHSPVLTSSPIPAISVSTPAVPPTPTVVSTLETPVDTATVKVSVETDEDPDLAYFRKMIDDGKKKDDTVPW